MPQKVRGQTAEISYLMLEANSQCNLRCRTCTRELLARRGLRRPARLDAATLRFLLSRLAGLTIDTIKFEGLSEPMLHPDFAELGAILREHYPEAFLIVATNGQYRAEKTPLLATIPVIDMLYLSIDGYGRNYELQRRGALWSRFLRTLAVLRDRVPPEERRRKLFFNVTVTEHTYRDLPLVYDLQREYGLAGVRINLCQHWDGDEVNPWSFPSEMLHFLRVYAADVKGVAGWTYRQCFWPFSGLVVDVNGNVRTCVLDTTAPPLGNLFVQELPDIFERSGHYLATRRALRRDQPGPRCRTCDYAGLSGLLSELFGSEGRGNAPRPFLDLGEAGS